MKDKIREILKKTVYFVDIGTADIHIVGFDQAAAQIYELTRLDSEKVLNVIFEFFISDSDLQEMSDKQTALKLLMFRKLAQAIVKNQDELTKG